MCTLHFTSCYHINTVLPTVLPQSCTEFVHSCQVFWSQVNSRIIHSFGKLTLFCQDLFYIAVCMGGVGDKGLLKTLKDLNWENQSWSCDLNISRLQKHEKAAESSPEQKKIKTSVTSPSKHTIPAVATVPNASTTDKKRTLVSSFPSKWGNKRRGVVMTSARIGVRGEVGWRNDRASLNNSGTDHSFLLPPSFLQRT